ncbi:RidA family protein [Novosphingobium kaempferiae]|uniref:RidA family protein n=1 Tax=Novosphingobium kaempferiae TaxID=2896849 RepID=UPI001E47C5FF|nr:Rid family hydrolase [Novosphingobium kaempferiae]
MTDPKAPQAIWPNIPQPLMPYSPAVKAADWIFVSGQLASDFKTGIAAEARPANPNLESDQALQSRFVMETLKRTLAAGGADLSKDVARIWQWLPWETPSMPDFAKGDCYPEGLRITPYLDVRNDYIFEPRPASTAVSIRALPVRDARIEIDVIAIVDGSEPKGFAAPEGVPAPLAGYSPALRRGDWIFLAGEVPTDWQGDYGEHRSMGAPGALAREARTNPHVWYGSDIEAQTDYTLSKLERIAEAAGGSLKKVVKADVYIGDPSDYAGMDRAWKRWFKDNPPARCVIPYMGLGTRGSRIEIALTLLADDATLKIERIETSEAPEPWSHEPQAVKVGNFLFLSQQMACDSKGVLAEGMLRHENFPWYGLPGKNQMRYMLKNVAAICEAGGTKLENVVRRACFHDEGTHFADSIEEWSAHFPGVKPASTTMKIGGPLVVPGANALLDLIAYVPD